MSRIPRAKITLNGKDITDKISGIVMSVSVTEKVHGDSNDLELELDNYNLDLLEHPIEKGATLSVEMWYEEETGKVYKAGSFTVDSIEYKGTADEGDTVRISGQSASTQKTMREKQDVKYENTSLKKIVTEVATRSGLGVLFEGEDIQVERITQLRQTNLEFLLRLADKFGYRVTVRNNTVLFQKWDKLKNAPASKTVKREDCRTYSIKYTSTKVYKGAKNVSYDSKKKETITSTVGATQKSCDTIVTEERVENQEQGKAVAESELHKNNNKEMEATFEMEGDSGYYAGINIQLDGFKKLNQKLMINEVSHTLTPDEGWRMTLTSQSEKEKKEKSK